MSFVLAIERGKYCMVLRVYRSPGLVAWLALDWLALLGL